MEPSHTTDEPRPIVERRLSGAFDAVALGGALHGATLTRALAHAGVALPPGALAPVLDQLLDDVAAVVDVGAASVRVQDGAGGGLRLHGVRGDLDPGALPAVVERPGDDRIPGRGGYTVPLRVAEGELLGCVSLHGPEGWQPGVRERRLVDALVRGAIAGADNLRVVAAAMAEFAERQRTEDALRLAETRFRRLMDANVMGIAIASPGGVHEANDEFLRHAGHTQDDLAAGRVDWRAITPPEFRDADDHSLEELLATGAATPFEKEYQHADGRRVRVLLGATLLERDPLRWVAFTIDVTARHAAETALAERVADWETLFELVPFPLLIADDPACEHMRANAAYQRLTGIAPDVNPSVAAPEAPPPYWPLYRGKPVPVEDLPMQRAARTGQPVQDDDFDLEFADGRRVRLASWAQPRRDAAGNVRGAIGAFVDITEREQRERHSRLLADVSEALATSLDYEATVRQVARLVLPSLADWSIVHLVEGVDAEGQLALRRVAVAHADPARQRDADHLLTLAERPNRRSFVYEAVATRAARYVPEVADAELEASAVDAEHLRLLRRLGVGAVAVLPLHAGTGVRGALSFVREPGRAPFTDAEQRVLSEVAARASLALANATLYREAQEAARVKGEFLAVMSHELRTPLQAILGYTGLIDEGISGPVSEAQRQHLGRIHGAAGHLLTLIDEVLTLSRLEAGREQLFPERTDLRDIVRQALALLEPTAATRGLALVAELPEAPLMVDVDPKRLRQVLLNLVANAIKFTPTGSVTVRVAAEGEWVRLAVVDTGVGIAAEQLPRVFESFWRADGSLTRRTSGAGLGLTISRHLVTLMGGSIGVESEEGQGSTFTVLLPGR